MKYEQGFPKEPQKKKTCLQAVAKQCPRPSSHAPFQITLTILQVATASVAFVLAAILRSHLLRLNANYRGELSNDDQPCARTTMPVCDGRKMDKCQSDCCPTGYLCVRDPTVGLYCQEMLTTCGNLDYCLDVADVPGTCEKEPCLRRHSVLTMSSVIYVLAAGGIVLDLLDLVWCVALSDNVLLKSITNLLGCLVKWLAFGGLVGA